MRNLLWVMALFVAACDSPVNPWTRSRTAKDQGVVVAGPTNREMAEFLIKNGLSGRVLGQSKRLYDIDTIDAGKLKDTFPEALVIKDRILDVGLTHSGFEQSVDLYPEHAREISYYQLSGAGVAEAHELSLGEGILVAVIDSGLDVSRYDLIPNLWHNPGEIPGNDLDDDGNGYVDDVHGWNFADDNDDLMDSIPHGTMSAAVIASAVTGIAPRAQVMGLKITDATGMGRISNVVEAIAYALDQGVHLINYSLGSDYMDPELAKILEYVLAADVLFVASAGNMGKSCAGVPFFEDREAFSNMIMVGAVNLPPFEAEMSHYSNYGTCVDIAAPAGKGYFESWMFERGILAAEPGHPTAFHFYHGTSAAAPAVTGVAALMISLDPFMTSYEIKMKLMKSATVYDSLNGLVRSGALNAARALRY